MNKASDLINVANIWCHASGKTLAQASYQIFKDSRRLDQIAAGQIDPRLSSYENALIWFDAHWPDSAEWPEGIERPEAEADTAQQVEAAE